MFSIATWNVNSVRVRLEHVLDWLREHQPDVLALQEIKLTADNFPLEALQEAGYTAIVNGQKTYNGVATLSRDPATTLATGFTDYPDPQRRVLCTLHGDLAVLNLYVPNGSAVGTEKYTYKLEWLEHLEAYVDSLMREYPRCLLLGDFNIAPADEDVHDPEEWRDKVLCSEPERAAFTRLLGLGLADSCQLQPPEEQRFTWWDYRAAAFRRNRGLRIDHILASPALAEHCRSWRVDLGPRRLERPSDHAPVVAEFDL